MTASTRQTSGGRASLMAALALFLIVAGAISLSRGTPASGATVVISKTDPTKAIPRGAPETVLHYAQARNSTRFAETRAYIYEVYRLAPLVGIDPAFVISQSALETADWTSFYWTEYLNPAGIGIGYSGAPSYTWISGAASARYHLVHLYAYVAGPLDAGNPLYPYRTDGPGTHRVFQLGYDGQAQIIDDLTGRWAVDPIYGQKIANRGNAIFASSGTDPVQPAQPASSVDASAGNDPLRTRDGYIKSSWAVEGTGSPPPGAYITFDMGRRIIFERIQWAFRLASYADSYQVQTSNDAMTWTTRGAYGNPVANSWTRLTTAGTARYIRFLFANPNGDQNLGYLAEVEFYGIRASGVPTATFTPYPSPSSTNTPLPTATPSPTATATKTPGPTRTPSALPGVPIPIVGSGGSGIGTSSKAIRDGKLSTTWQTQATTPPSTAQVYVDLGDVGTITGVEFTFRRANGARLYSIRVSNDKRTWTTVATLDYVSPLEIQRARFTVSARYVQFVFTNTNGTAQLGYLADVRVFGSLGTFDPASDPTEPPPPTPTFTSTAEPVLTATPMETPTPFEPKTVTVDPTATETATATATQPDQASPIALDPPLPIASYRRTANSTDAGILSDGDTGTTWQSGEPLASMIYVSAELAEETAVGFARIVAGPNGIAGEIAIEATTDGITWTNVPASVSPDPYAVTDLLIDTSVVAVRIVVGNSTGLETIGGIAEFHLYP